MISIDGISYFKQVNVDEGRPHIMFPIFIYALCMQFSFGYLHSSAVTSYKDALLGVVPHAVLNIFAKFSSQVGKILITAININGPVSLALSRHGARARLSMRS